MIKHSNKIKRPKGGLVASIGLLHRNDFPSKGKDKKLQSNYKTTPAPKALGKLQKRGWKNCRSQRTREFSMRLNVMVRSDTISIKSHDHGCPNVR